MELSFNFSKLETGAVSASAAIPLSLCLISLLSGTSYWILSYTVKFVVYAGGSWRNGESC